MSELLGILPLLVMGLVVMHQSFWGAALGAIGGIIGGRSDRKRRNEIAKTREDAWHRLMEQYKLALAEQKSALRGGYEPLRQQLEMLQAAAIRSDQQITEVGQAARQDIRDQTQQAIAGAGASMQNRGLYNTTGFDQARMQGAYQGNRATADLGGQIAGIRSENTLRGAAMVGQGYRDLSNYSLAEFQGLSSLWGQNLQQQIYNPFLNKGGQVNSAGMWGTAGANIGGFLDDIDWGSLFGGGGSSVATFGDTLSLGF